MAWMNVAGSNAATARNHRTQMAGEAERVNSSAAWVLIDKIRTVARLDGLRFANGFAGTLMLVGLASLGLMVATNGPESMTESDAGVAIIMAVVGCLSGAGWILLSYRLRRMTRALMEETEEINAQLAQAQQGPMLVLLPGAPEKHDTLTVTQISSSGEITIILKNGKKAFHTPGSFVGLLTWV